MTPVTPTRALVALVLAAVLTAILGGAGPATAVPAAAGPSTDPVSGLVGGLLGQPLRDGHDREDTGSAARADRGRTHAPDGVLRKGCRNYPYRYRLKIRTDDWTLETFLDDRTGETVASGAFTAGPDPKRHRSHFRFCRYVTHPGRFTIRAKLVWYTDSGEHQTWLEPSHFRLRRR